jgi:putative addiction module component (TIGR02574 family)
MNIREEIEKLSLDEKIQLAMDIWDSIPDIEKDILTDEKKLMLNERLQAIEVGNATFYTWDEVKAKLIERKKQSNLPKD